MNLGILLGCAAFMVFMAIATYGAEGHFAGARPYASAAFILVSIGMAWEK